MRLAVDNVCLEIMVMTSQVPSSQMARDWFIKASRHDAREAISWFRMYWMHCS